MVDIVNNDNIIFLWKVSVIVANSIFTLIFTFTHCGTHPLNMDIIYIFQYINKTDTNY